MASDYAETAQLECTGLTQNFPLPESCLELKLQTAVAPSMLCLADCVRPAEGILVC